jgi:hypothetical protein
MIPVSDGDHDLPSGVILFQVPKGFGGLPQGIGPMNERRRARNAQVRLCRIGHATPPAVPTLPTRPMAWSSGRDLQLESHLRT